MAQLPDASRAERRRHEPPHARVVGALGLEQVDAHVAAVIRQPVPAGLVPAVRQRLRRRHMVHAAAEAPVEHEAADVVVDARTA